MGGGQGCWSEEEEDHYFPLHLTPDILTRLPAKSLKRFQCVSKEWLSIIQNPRFIHSFTSLSQTRPRILLAVRTHENRVFLLSSSSLPNDADTSTSTPLITCPEMRKKCFLADLCFSTSLVTNLQLTLSGSLVDLLHCSSAHGFFGFSPDPGQFTICNPSTGQVIRLPGASSSTTDGIYMYLGYDPVGNEYKVLRSMTSRGQPSYQEHKVLSLGGGGGNLSWRDMKSGITPPYTAVSNGICINGVVFYFAWTLAPVKKPVLLFFDVRGESLGCILTFPNSISGSLINYKGKFGTAYPLSYGPHPWFRVMVLEDIENGVWLTKDICCHPFFSQVLGNIRLTILGVNKTGEVIFGPQKLPPKHEPLFLYYYTIEREDKFITRVELKGFQEFGCNHRSDEQCGCQIFFSLAHFEYLFSL